jgi:hypothetical protein
MTRLRIRIPAVLGAGAVGAIAGSALDEPRVSRAAVLLAAIVLGELLVLRLEDGTGIPTAYAPTLVVVAGMTSREALVIGGAALVIGAVVRVDHRGMRARLATLTQRALVGVAAFGAFRATFAGFGRTESIAAVLGALAAAAAAMLVVDEIGRRAQGLGSALTPRGTRAWSALVATGLLMALGYRGVDGRGGAALWSVALFSIPLFAAWYSFERLAAVTRTHRQTLAALSMATEMAGFVPDGHGRRVADLCERLAHEVGIDAPGVEHVVAAAHLHHLGVVTMDDPPSPRDPDGVPLIADVTAAMLADIPALTEASRIVAGQGRYARDLRGSGDERLASQVLKVASDFDDLAEGDPSRARLALEALYASPGYVYDRRVLEALEVIVA